MLINREIWPKVLLLNKQDGKYKMRVVFTVAALNGFHGSVIHVFEWAQFLVHEGHEVTVITGTYKEEIVKLFNRSHIDVRHINDNLQNNRWDCGFAYHFPFITKLLHNGVVFRKLIIGCLSSFELLETPPFFWKDCNLVVTMSAEAKDHICSRYSIPHSKVCVIENGIPSSFFNSYKEDVSEKIRYVGVVSNHIPEEIYSLRKSLEGVADVKFIGVNGDFCEFVTPELLKKFDVIITIGKTVQYCLGLGIPVYEYDHFGGNGYITTYNFYTERRFNFSGRPNKRKLTADIIIKELFVRYGEALCYREELSNLARNNFCFERKLRRVLQDVFKNKTRPISLDIICGQELQFDHDLAFANYFSHLHSIINSHEEEKRELETLKISNECLKREVLSLENSLKLSIDENKKLMLDISKVHEKNMNKIHRRIGRFINNRFYYARCSGIFKSFFRMSADKK